MTHQGIKVLDDGTVLVELTGSIYSLEAIRATTYKFTDRCYIKIDTNSDRVICVCFSKKTELGHNLETIAKEFYNELVDQQVRVDIEQRFGDIRNLIVRKAFSSIEPINKKGKSS